ncbi:MAG: PQQ-binding-like beta-propeller repeat protein [Gemmatimonadetes bacterium]|nr:PQQ-binding-like beta-propeller repeat protein [Gemmatimonadota bacterium]
MSRFQSSFVRVRVTRALSAGMVGLLVAGSCAPAPPAAMLPIEEKFNRWATYEGDATGSSFSALDQINRSNVSQLQVAWTYPIGDNSGYGFNPIVIDSIMYVLGRGSSIAAIHAGSGRELWLSELGEVTGGVTNRGIMYWESADRSERRILTSKGQYLHAIDAVTGDPVRSFGTNGRVNLREGLGRDARLVVSGQSPSPGRVFENLVILGSAPGESYASAPGHIRAYDVRSGRLVWRFNTIPHPGEYGYETWPSDAYLRVGGVNAWGGLSVDEARGIVYVPLGSPSYDFYGADRLGSNLFGNSLVALNARTGQRIWHFQTVHHDLWDMDLAATPTLMTVRHEGRMRDVVAVATKLGFLFVLDRVSGESLWPIDERPVPASDVPGEVAWPTQPHPRSPEPFSIQSFTPDDVNPYLPPAEQDSVRRRLAEILNLGETLFQPPSLRPTMQMPGNNGGANWGSTGGDPRDGSFFVVSKNVPTVLQLTPIRAGEFGTGTTQVDRGAFVYQQRCTSCHMPDRQGQPPMIPPLSGAAERIPADQFHAVVKQGRGLMPAFPDLTDQEVNAIYAYLERPEMALAPAAQPAEGASAPPSRYQTGYGYYSVSGGMHARRPPFTTMTKYDLNTGRKVWQVPVGRVTSLVERGIAVNTGSSQFAGGPAITAGGLVFLINGDRLNAYDTDTGEELWAARLPTAGQGIPAVYRQGGRQYVVVAAGTGGPTRPDGSTPRAYVAYALPARLLGR